MVISIATAYDAIPIHAIQTKNVTIVNFKCFRQSGVVIHRIRVIGYFNRYVQQFISSGTLYGVSASSAMTKQISNKLNSLEYCLNLFKKQNYLVQFREWDTNDYQCELWYRLI